MRKTRGKRHTGAKARKNRKLVILSGIVAGAATVFVLAVAFYVIFGMNPPKTEVEDVAATASSIVEPEVIPEYLNQTIIEAIVSGGKRLRTLWQEDLRLLR